MKCKRCEIEKEENDFSKGVKVCKKCKVEIAREWKKNNPERVKISEKKRRELRKEELREYQAKWRNENRDRFNEIQAKWRNENREISRKRCLDHYHENKWKYKEWRENNLKKCREYSSLYRQRNIEKIRSKRREQEKINRRVRPVQYKARKDVYNALCRGILKKSDKCQVCGKKEKLQVHHMDYLRPLEVIWVCSLCHGGIHMTLRRNKIDGK